MFVTMGKREVPAGTGEMIFKLLVSLEKLSYGTPGVKGFEPAQGPTVALCVRIQKGS